MKFFTFLCLFAVTLYSSQDQNNSGKLSDDFRFKRCNATDDADDCPRTTFMKQWKDYNESHPGDTIQIRDASVIDITVDDKGIEVKTKYQKG